jgi:hypothetical protein
MGNNESLEALQAAQEELMKHHWDTFCTQPLSIAEGGKGVIVSGCVAGRKLLCANNQYLSHLALDVLPQSLTALSPGASYEQRACPAFEQGSCMTGEQKLLQTRLLRRRAESIE